MSIYPWQQGQWQYLIQRQQQTKVPHALLLTGSEGMGKQLFAQAFVKTLLCKQASSNGEPCQTCKSCQLLAANNHPDYSYVAPVESGKAIKIDQIRELTQFLRDTTQLDGYKVALIINADAMNNAAANALLKTLEEPEGRCVLILTTAQPSLLPATIRSRCHKVSFPPVQLAAIKPWLREQLNSHAVDMLLNMADGAPLKAVALNEQLSKLTPLLDGLLELAAGRKNLTETVKLCQAMGLLELLTWLSGLVSDIIKLQLAQSSQHLMFVMYVAELKKLAQSAKLDALYLFLDEIIVLRKQLLSHINLNQPLQLERILYQWRSCWCSN